MYSSIDQEYVWTGDGAGEGTITAKSNLEDKVHETRRPGLLHHTVPVETTSGCVSGAFERRCREYCRFRSKTSRSAALGELSEVQALRSMTSNY